MDVLKLQRELYESAGSTFAKAWESQKFTVLLMYCAIPPARGREYRELRFTFTEEDLQLWEPDSTQSNWLLMSGNHSRGLLYVGAHKTYRHIGVQRIELSADGSTNVLLISRNWRSKGLRGIRSLRNSMSIENVWTHSENCS